MLWVIENKKRVLSNIMAEHINIRLKLAMDISGIDVELGP